MVTQAHNTATVVQVGLSLNPSKPVSANPHPILQGLNSARRRLSAPLAILAAFMMPLKLSFTYIALTPLILLWLFGGGMSRHAVSPREPGAALIYFLAVAACSSLFGFAPVYSFWKILGAALFVCTVFAMRDIADKRVRWRILIALCLGQSIAALHTVMEATFPTYIKPIFIGKVTESGQLALTVVITIAMVLAVLISERKVGSPALRSYLIRTSVSGIFLVAFALAIAFGSRHKALSETVQTWVLIGFIVTLGLGIVSLIKLFSSSTGGDFQSRSILRTLLSLILPLLLAALCINLKRGPWLGVLVASTILLIMYNPRLVPILILLTLGIGWGIEPVRERIAESSAHFFISGGRSEMWDIGFDLIQRYPLGIGVENSPILQKFSPEIPAQLRHFHSNLINVGAETGLFGLVVFVWALVLCIRYGFRIPRSNTQLNQHWMIASGISCAIIAWQVAGFVEYNFGDSEVKLIAFTLLGVMTRMVNDFESSQQKLTQSS